VGDVKLARVPATKTALLQPSAYRYFRRVGTQASWVVSEGDATVVASAPVGEPSVMYNEFLARWIMMYIAPDTDDIVVREGPLLEGPRSQ
jgi:hypothetical protein